MFERILLHNLTISLFRVIDRRDFKEVSNMNQNQIIGEIKYRFASLLLDQLLEDSIITREVWTTFKKNNPIISVLEDIDEKDNLIS